MSRATGLEENSVVPSVEFSEEVRLFVLARGGTLYLHVRKTRCCSGALTFLDADVEPRRDRDRYLSCASERLEVRLLDAGVGLPRQISVEVRGRRRPHLVAYWNGCAYRM
jgi:hypothetical protein